MNPPSPTLIRRLRARLLQTKFGQAAPVVRRVVVGIVGGTIVLVGVAMVVLPGPAFIVIPAGLAVLATEFVWARRVVEWGREKYQKLQAVWKKRNR